MFSSMLGCAGRGWRGDGLCSAIKMVRRHNTKTLQAESLRLRPEETRKLEGRRNKGFVKLPHQSEETEHKLFT